MATGRAAAALAALAAVAHGQQTGRGYTYWCSGECDRGSGATPEGGVVFMGGGTDVDDAFRWMVKRSGKGDLLVLRTSGDQAYNSYVMGFGAHSAATLLLTAEGSDSSFVIDKIDGADALWFAGGDQSTYADYWNGTKVADAIDRALARGVPVGGTSAGCAILGRTVYTSRTGSVTSAEALSNPYDKEIDLAQGFIDYRQAPTRGVTDMHFGQRDRFGRLLAFMARSGAPGIAMDEHTALTVEPSGIATAVGVGTAYVATGGRPVRVQPGRSLSFTGVAVTCLRAQYGGVYDFKRWAPDSSSPRDGYSQYTIDVEDGEARDGSGSSYIYCSADAAAEAPSRLGRPQVAASPAPVRSLPNAGQGLPRRCPDGSECPFAATCCPLAEKNSTAQAYGCCGGENAVCCAGGRRCCPGGYHCTQGGLACAADRPAAHPLAEWQPAWHLCSGPLPLQRLDLGNGVSFPYFAERPVERVGRGARLAVLMVHGAGRNADDYYCTMREAAKLQQDYAPEEVYVLAPWFTQPQDQAPPRCSYWNGDDSDGVWRYGADSDSSPRVSSYAVVDRLLAAIAASAPGLERITVAGHSSGGQFVQRYALTHPEAAGLPPVRYVLANPSSYAYLDGERWVGPPQSRDPWGVPPAGRCPEYNKWKWGLAGNAERLTVPYVFDQALRPLLRRYPRLDVTYLAGQNDTCNENLTPGCESFGLEKTCMDMLEGSQRRERAERYYAYLEHHYGRRVHSLAEVPNAGHDHALVFQSRVGLRAVFAR
eukprot:TRINITY_DN46909_c0_g1_i1.p1 TRINITY_DN46909_c0_g1~~TRINITY_DN46909_c0_g1_i1.p1  ORF type:complete len:790 (+),score=246.37 TRINITY_DN46909_c0_g1_i1:80-2371(+)